MSFLLRALKRQKPRSEHACCSVLTHSRESSLCPSCLTPSKSIFPGTSSSRFHTHAAKLERGQSERMAGPNIDAGREENAGYFPKREASGFSPW